MTSKYFIFGVFVIGLIGAIIASYHSTKTKKNMKCFAFRSQESHFKVRSALENAGIFFTDFLWADAQSGYDEPGAAQRTPKEIWVNLADVERVREIILNDLKYKIETAEFALIVSDGLADDSSN
jgi:hypothetical protein